MRRPSSDLGLASDLVRANTATQRDARLALRISDALHAREIIAQAQGVVMARQHVGPSEAAAMLHRAARSADLDVLTFATDIVRTTGTAWGPAISQAHD